jgi:predicted extracellular nuclease
MANTLNNTLNKVGDAIEAVMGGAKKSTPYNDPNRVYTGQTCLERFGMEARSAHLMRNEWKRDLQYTKLLVDAEYLIQTEFKVSSYEDRLKEQAEAKAERDARKAEKQAEKKAKKAEKDAKKDKNAASVQGGIPEDRPAEPKENIGDFTVTKIGNQTFTTYRTYGIYGKSN